MDGDLSMGFSSINALALLVAAATGGTIPAVYWKLAMRTATNPYIHESLQHAATNVYDYASDLSYEAASSQIAWFTFGAGILVGFTLAFFTCLCCGLCVCSSGGAWYLGRRSVTRSVPDNLLESYARMAQLLDSGGDSAIRSVSTEIKVSETSLRDWGILWKRVLRGPRRS